MIKKLIFSCMIAIFASVYADVTKEKTIVTNVELQKKNTQGFDIEEDSLENGLKIVVINKKSARSIYFALSYFVGSADDPRSVVGISHFLEHMMFQGTKNISGKKTKEMFDKYVSYANAWTNEDMTCYIHNCNKIFLPISLKIEADRMVNLKLDENQIEKERKVILEERKMRQESNPMVRYVVEQFYKNFFLYSKYSYPVIGYEDQIKECNKEALEKHYKKFYVPNNAVAIFIGDITIQEAKTLLTKYFGKIKKGPENKRDEQRVIDPKNIGIKNCIEHESDQISWHNFNTVYKIEKDLVDSFKKSCMCSIILNSLAGDTSSVLYKILVDQKKLALTVGSIFEERLCDKRKINISIVAKDEESIKNSEKVIDQTISDFIEKYYTLDIFEKEKSKLLDAFEIAEDSPLAIADILLQCIILKMPLSDLKKIKTILKEITFEETRELAQKIFDPKNNIIKLYSHPVKNQKMSKA